MVSTLIIKSITNDKAVNQWIQQLYINPSAVGPSAPLFSPLPVPLFLLPCSLGRIQTKRHLCWLASLPDTQTTAAPPPFSSCSSHRQQPSCLGSEKLICSTDELLRSTRLSANVDVEWMEGRFKEEHVWTDRVRWCTSVCVCVCLWASLHTWICIYIN